MFSSHGVVLLCPVIFLCLLLASYIPSAPVYSEHPNFFETFFLLFILTSYVLYTSHGSKFLASFRPRPRLCCEVPDRNLHL